MSVRTRVRNPAAAVVSAARGTPNGAARGPILNPIITMNAGGIIQSASDSVEQVFGWTPTELFGRNVKMLIPQPRRSALDRYLDRYRRADKVSGLARTRQFEAVRKDGKPIKIELSMSRADLPPHAAPFFIGIIRDVSHEIDTGADTPAERTRLQRLITEQTRALATAHLRLHLADRLASLGTLAAGLGHDMNGVLLPVRARLEALEHGEISPAARAHVTAVRQSISYLQRLSDGLQFLAVDPDSPGVSGADDAVTNLAEWWGQVGPLLGKSVPSHVTLQISLPAGLPAVRIAPQWLTQAVLNVIVNAGEAIPGGRRRGRVRLWANTAEDGRTVRLGVTDNGRGMAQGIVRRAFDPFFTTKPRSMGTGLGLALARKVVVRAGGDIKITSEPGRGTSVVMILKAASRSAVRGASSARRARVAVVSVRDRRSAAFIAQVLLGAGLEVKVAGKGAPGDADLWVTTPTTQALEAARRWRKRPGARKAARAVVLLGNPPERLKKHWDEVGATVVGIPADLGAIRHAVGEAMEGSGG